MGWLYVKELIGFQLLSVQFFGKYKEITGIEMGIQFKRDIIVNPVTCGKRL